MHAYNMPQNGVASAARRGIYSGSCEMASETSSKAALSQNTAAASRSNDVWHNGVISV